MPVAYRCKHPASRTDQSDGALVMQALAGDQGAFAALTVRYSGPLLRYIRTFLHDEDQALDTLQFVLLQLYLALPTLSIKVPLRGWLFHVARNRCLDELRKQRRRNLVYFSQLEEGLDEDELSPVELIADGRPLPEELMELHEHASSVRAAVNGLPAKYRTIVHLRSIGQLSFSEIGERLHMPETSVKTYYYRSLPLLRKVLEQRSTLQ